MPAHVADCSPGVRKVLKSLWEVEAMPPGVADHTGNTPIRQRLVPTHVADYSPGVRKVLKSEWEVEAVSPGVADHITLGVAAGAGLVAVHVAVEASAGARRIGGCARGGLFSWGA